MRPTYDDATHVEEPKASMARRYKELCRLQTQIAMKAAQLKKHTELL